jgi:coenzyme F420-reducing hydrogenase gamma subunit
MSFLDLDERLVELVQRVDIVYSPLVDTKDLHFLPYLSRRRQIR